MIHKNFDLVFQSALRPPQADQFSLCCELRLRCISEDRCATRLHFFVLYCIYSSSALLKKKKQIKKFTCKTATNSKRRNFRDHGKPNCWFKVDHQRRSIHEPKTQRLETFQFSRYCPFKNFFQLLPFFLILYLLISFSVALILFLLLRVAVLLVAHCL